MYYYVHVFLIERCKNPIWYHGKRGSDGCIIFNRDLMASCKK